MVSNYLFDLDGTLVDSAIYTEIYNPVMNKIRNQLGFTYEQLEQKAKKSGLGKNRFGRWDSGDLCREFGLLELYYALLKEKIEERSFLNAEVLNLLKEIKYLNKKTGIVSNSMRRTISLYVDRFPLKNYVDFTFSQEDAGCGKQEEEFWHKLIEQMKLDTADSIIIGDDNYQDVVVPSRLGFKTYLIRDTKNFARMVKDLNL